MISIGDAQNGKRKVENPENMGVFTNTKLFIKHYLGKVSAGLMVIVLIAQLIPAIIDFCLGDSKRNNNNDRHHNGRRLADIDFCLGDPKRNNNNDSPHNGRR